MKFIFLLSLEIKINSVSTIIRASSDKGCIISVPITVTNVFSSNVNIWIFSIKKISCRSTYRLQIRSFFFYAKTPACHFVVSKIEMLMFYCLR